MTDAEILQLAYQKQAAGDTRPLSEIIASVRLDAALLVEPVAPDTVVMHSCVRLPDGTIQEKKILADGTEI